MDDEQPRLDASLLSSNASIPFMAAEEHEVLAETMGDSLLHLSIAAGHADVLQLLLQKTKIGIDQRDSAGFTPLQRAVMSGRTDMVMTLLEHGATI